MIDGLACLKPYVAILHRTAERTGQIGDRGVYGDDEIERRDRRGGIGEIAERAHEMVVEEGVPFKAIAEMISKRLGVPGVSKVYR